MDSIRQLRIALGCLGVLMILLFVGMLLWQHASVNDSGPDQTLAENPANEPLPPAPAAPARQTSQRLQEIDKLLWSNPEQAARICRKVLNSSADTEEKTGAAKRFPKCLQQLFEKRRTQKAYPECQAIFDEMQKICPDARESGEVANLWRGLRQQWLEESLRKDELDAVAKLIGDMRADKFSDASALNHTIREYVERTWKKAAQLGDYAKADALFKEFLPLDGSDYSLVELWFEYKALRWKAARDAGEKTQARAHLLDCAPLAGRRLLQISDILYKLPGPLLRPFGEEFSSDELAPLGDDFATQRNRLAALTCYGFALSLACSKVTYNPKTGVPSTTTLSDAASRQKQQDLLQRIDKCARELVQDLADGKIAGLGYAQTKLLFGDLIAGYRRTGVKRDEAWVNTALALQKFQTARVQELMAAGKLSDADSEMREMLSLLGEALWNYDCEQNSPGLWMQVPEAVRQEIARTQPKANEQERLAFAGPFILSGRFIPPRMAAVAPIHQDLKARLLEQRVLQALAALEKNTESALWQMRPLLREYGATPIGKRIVSGLQIAIQKARQNKWFTALNDLCAFYVAEVGPPPVNDPFREDLRVALKGLADEYTTRSPMTRVFVLSLLADALPDDLSAQKARQEAMDTGLKLMRTLPSQPLDKPRLVMPSLIPGCSVLCVENLTYSHLMIFLDGAERCFARVNPLRKGTLVIKDGNYVSAVVVTADDVIPYRSDKTYQSETQWANYYIRRSTDLQDPGSTPGALEKASGGYRLLRVPPGVQAQVDPESGMAMPVKK